MPAAAPLSRRQQANYIRYRSRRAYRAGRQKERWSKEAHHQRYGHRIEKHSTLLPAISRDQTPLLSPAHTLFRDFLGRPGTHASITTLILYMGSFVGQARAITSPLRSLRQRLRRRPPPPASCVKPPPAHYIPIAPSLPLASSRVILYDARAISPFSPSSSPYLHIQPPPRAPYITSC